MNTTRTGNSKLMFALHWASALIVAVAHFGYASAEELSGYSGAELYRRYCAACHGVHGRGDGPVASDMNVVVPDLTRIAKRHRGAYPEDDVRRIIDGRAVHMAHGTRDMPVWGVQFGAAMSSDSHPAESTNELLGRLVEYLRSIQAK